MLIKNQIIGFILLLYYNHVNTARILAIFPTPSISHQVVFRPLTQELVKRGHEVIVVTTDPAFPSGHAPTNLTEIDVHDISYKHWHELLLTHEGKKATLEQLQNLLIRFTSVLDLQLQTPEVKELLKKPKNYFDLVLLEACNRAAVGITKKFDAPIIQISSMGLIPGHYGYLGAPMHPLLYPTFERQRIYSLTRWEKILELMKHVLLEYLIRCTEKHSIDLIRKHFSTDDNIDMDELFKHVKMVFVNEHFIWADNRPIPPNINFIGGIHQTVYKELPNDLKSYMDTSENGVIYMSFGTNVIMSSLPSNTFKIMMKAFSKLPYDVLMKWDDGNVELPEHPDNVRIQKWFPQSDILKHPKIKLFITQAGLQSTDEAINAAVPLLAIPMLGDQWYNAEKYVRHKIGLRLEFNTLNEVEFKKSIETIITDKSYKNNILRLRTLMREHPVKPLDLAVWWIEHIIKHGGDHLIPPSAYLSWTEYYEVELIIICISVILIFTSLIVYLIKIFIKIIKKLCFSNAKVKTK